jgi:hypothetical protein
LPGKGLGKMDCPARCGKTHRHPSFYGVFQGVWKTLARRIPLCLLPIPPFVRPNHSTSRKNSLTAMDFFFLSPRAAQKAGASNITFRAVKNSSPSAHTPSFP